MKDLERRAFPVKVEIRSDDTGPPRLVGYAAVFNTLSEDLGGFREKIKPGAFANSIKTSDIRALWNHNPDFVLGRNKAGTLALEEDERGLRIEIVPPDTTWAKDLVESIRRGDVDQMSFGFRTKKDEWDESDPRNIIRTLVEVELFDVSPVTYPAYPATSIGIRSAKEILEAHSAAQASVKAAEIEAQRNQARVSVLRRKLELLEKF
ncbi:MAG: HK97 family phage prohead protease [Thermosyntropha sp.]|nr:HK97 family phage prohead protease [Thermosyntropha sp.]MBO8158836.1 HK97 family phage prohead protease [Thermosyntropha sp.]